MGGDAGQFHTTPWTVVMVSAQEQSRTGQAPLAALCQIYWCPLYTLRAGADIHRMTHRI